jgi:hypothetical protein
VGFEALDLALALHANPGRIAELRARPLPTQGMAPLLRIALGQADALTEAAAVFPDDPRRLVDAARFFVEQQLLAREFDHDPWRVLGVNPGAAPELLRAHHHLLVRLVHPDRSDDWASAYADRVNRAWRQLRSEEGRIEAARPSQSATAAEPWEAHVPATRALADSHPRAFVAAPMPRPPGAAAPLVWVAAGVALTLAATVAWQRLHHEPEPLAEADTEAALAAPPPWYAEAAPPTAPVEAAPLPVLVPIAPPDPTLDAVATPASAAPGKPAPTMAVSPTPSPTPAAPARRRATAPPRPPIPTTATAPAAVATIAPGATADADAATAADPAPEPAARAVAMESEPEPPAGPPVAAPAEPVPAAPQVQLDGPALLRGYRERYAAGDLGGLLGLYAREVHADTRRIAALARDYSRLFGNSQQRYIDFSAIRWERRDRRLLGQARYETGYRKGASLRKHLERGEVVVEVVLDGSTSRLRRFELRAD